MINVEKSTNHFTVPLYTHYLSVSHVQRHIMTCFHFQGFLLLLLSTVAVLLPLARQASAQEVDPVIFDFYEKPGCQGKRQSVSVSKYNNKGGRCYLPDGGGSYQSVFFHNFDGYVYTGGGCATRASAHTFNGCNGFQGNRYITGVADN